MATKLGGCIESPNGKAWYTFEQFMRGGFKYYRAIYHDEKNPEGMRMEAHTSTVSMIERIERAHPTWVFHL